MREYGRQAIYEHRAHIELISKVEHDLIDILEGRDTMRHRPADGADGGINGEIKKMMLHIEAPGWRSSRCPLDAASRPLLITRKPFNTLRIEANLRLRGTAGRREQKDREGAHSAKVRPPEAQSTAAATARTASLRPMV